MKILVDRRLVPRIISDSVSSDRETARDSDAAWEMLRLRNRIEACLTEPSLEEICQLYESRTTDSKLCQLKRQLELIFKILAVAPTSIYYAQRSAVSDLSCAVDVVTARANQIPAILTHQPQNYQGAGLSTVSIQDTPEDQLLEQLLRQAGSPLLLIGSLRDLLLLQRILAPLTPPEQQVIHPQIESHIEFHYGPDWLPLEELILSEAQTVAFRRGNSSSALLRGKLLKLDGLDRELLLVLRVQNHSENSATELELLFSLSAIEDSAAGNDMTLPAELEIRLLDECGRIISIHYPRSEDERIDLPVIGQPGEQFSLEFRRGNSRLTEEFEI